jgi:transcriptional regulator with XRE-family HTH domain
MARGKESSIIGRYDHGRAAAEVERMRRELGLSQKDVAITIDITEPEYSQKKRGIDNSFSLDEFGRIAEYFARKSGRPLIGFPFLDRQLQDVVDRKAGGWEPTKS